MARVIIFLGPPGAGKGTQAVMLAKELNYLHLSTGEMFRSAMEQGTDIGKQIKTLVDAGNLVPDAVTCSLVHERLSQPDATTGIILDGFPRNIDQAEELENILTKLGASIQVVIDVTVPEAVLFERIRRRGRESGRSDDTQDVLANRYQIYLKETSPVSAFYENKGLLRTIDGLGSVEEVASRIKAELA